MRIDWRPRRFEIAVVAALVIGLWVVLMFAFAHNRSFKRGVLCQSNLKNIALASKQYERDYDERFPLPNNWTAGLLPYHKSPAGFHCPSMLKNGYAVNKHLNGLSHVQVYARDVQKIPQYFETQKHEVNVSGAQEVWLSETRHPQGVGITFIDGHFRWRQQPPIFRAFPPALKPTSGVRKAK